MKTILGTTLDTMLKEVWLANTYLSYPCSGVSLLMTNFIKKTSLNNARLTLPAAP